MDKMRARGAMNSESKLGKDVTYYLIKGIRIKLAEKSTLDGDALIVRCARSTPWCFIAAIVVLHADTGGESDTTTALGSYGWRLLAHLRKRCLNAETYM